MQKALQACEGALLLVDASQGVEAQTVANAYLAVEADLTVVPVLNKIDLAARAARRSCARRSRTRSASTPSDALRVSAKTGAWACTELLDRIVERIPPPDGRSRRRRCAR